MAIKKAETRYGYNILLKLIPPARIATISLFEAILEVKKITEMKTRRGLKRLI